MSRYSVRMMLRTTSLGIGLMLAGCGGAEELGGGQQEPVAEQSQATPAEPTTGPVQSMSGVCQMWKGLGWEPGNNTMASYVVCSTTGTRNWAYYGTFYGVPYYKGTLNGVVMTGGDWAVRGNFANAAALYRSGYNNFVAGTVIYGSCDACLR